MNTGIKPLLPIIFLFILINTLILIVKSFLESNGFDLEFLLTANFCLFIITVGSFLFQGKSLLNPNPNVFVRGVYAGTILKMFACMIAVLIYVFINKSHINKPALFTAMGLYILYTVVEVSSLMKAAGKKTNA